MTIQNSSSIDPRFLIAVMVGLAGLVLYHRGVMGHVPHDLSAYLSAAEVFTRGLDPYTDAIQRSPHYQGYPYAYPPLTLPMLSVLAWVPAAAVGALDWVMRVAVITGSLRFLGRRWAPELPLGYLVFGAMFHEPLMIDALASNLAIYMFGGVLLTLALSERGWSAGRGVTSFGVGVLLGFKPVWTLPAFYAALSQGAWWAAAGVVSGSVGMIGFGALWMPELTASWAARVGEVQAWQQGVELWTLAPWAYPIAAAVASAVAIDLLRRRAIHPDLWLLGCVSLPIWPRLNSYTYILTIPWVLWLIGRKGIKRGLLWSLPVMGPLPWMMRVAGERVELAWLYGYACLAAAYLVVTLYRERDPAQEM